MVVSEKRWLGLQEVREAGTKITSCHNCLAGSWEAGGKGSPDNIQWGRCCHMLNWTEAQPVPGPRKIAWSSQISPWRSRGCEGSIVQAKASGSYPELPPHGRTRNPGIWTAMSSGHSPTSSGLCICEFPRKDMCVGQADTNAHSCVVLPGTNAAAAPAPLFSI